MTNTKCENGHLGPFVYEGEHETTGSPYALTDHDFVTLTCQSCWQETQQLSVHEIADLLNEIVTLPMHRKAQEQLVKGK